MHKKNPVKPISGDSLGYVPVISLSIIAVMFSPVSTLIILSFLMCKMTKRKSTLPGVGEGVGFMMLPAQVPKRGEL